MVVVLGSSSIVPEVPVHSITSVLVVATPALPVSDAAAAWRAAFSSSLKPSSATWGPVTYSVVVSSP